MAKRININAFKQFFQSEKIGGIILLFCVMVSLTIANSSYSQVFSSFLTQIFGFKIANFSVAYSVNAWVNDGLMAIFFLLVGLEIKREMVEGELSSFKKAALPVVAAIGGMLMPALIYLIFNFAKPTATGWGIPMATDIAFALAIIAMLGKKVPTSLKIFLAALAIADDLGAILVIALFYTAQIHWFQFLIAALIFAFLLVLNFFKVKSLYFYLIPGVFLWYFVHHSGIHATVAGVLLAFTIPTNNTAIQSPLEKLEHFLTTPVNYFIMPIFALVNTNISFQKNMVSALVSPLGLGIILGLIVGKTVGITLFSWFAVKIKLAKLPTGANWQHIVGVGMLAGIGFTMSVFIALLSFSNLTYITQAKFAILIGSVLSGFLGYFYLKNIKIKSIIKKYSSFGYEVVK